MKQYIKILFAALVVSVFVFGTIRVVKAEDGENEVEDREDNREDTKDTETHTEDREDDHKDESDDSWDLSHDFEESTQTRTQNQNTVQKEDVPVKIVKIREIVEVPVEIPAVVYDDINYTNLNITTNASFQNETNITIPEVDLSAYDDYDGDDVINKNDIYPGQDDLLMLDSDNDTVVDRYDRYSGANDSDFEDKDHDGVIDSKDSDVGKMTDKDHDGIDDAYDKHDGRSFMIKALSMLGFVR